MSKNKEISEGTNINLKLSHLISFLTGLTSIIVISVGFFYTMLSTNIEKKVDSAIYSIEKKHLEKNDEDFSSDVDDIKSSVNAINTTVQNIGLDIAEIKTKQNSGTTNTNHNNSTHNSNVPRNNTPSNLNF